MFSRPGTVARLSMMTTSWCCDKVSARFEPMKPAPPVTMERMKRLWQQGCLGLSELSYGEHGVSFSNHFINVYTVA